MDAAPQIEDQITFDNEDEWLKFANDNLPGSIVDVVDQEINWESESVIVLQGISAKGYFSSIPPITNVDIKNGILNFEYEDNVDTTNTFYIRSDDYSDMIKTIYMIVLDKIEIEKIN